MSALPAINPATLTAREVELLREIRVNFGNLDQLSADWRNEARNLLLRIEQAAGEPPMTKPNLGCAFNCEWPTKCCCIEGAMP